MNAELQFPKRFGLGIMRLIIAGVIGLMGALQLENLLIFPDQYALQIGIGSLMVFLWVIVFMVVARQWEWPFKVAVFLMFLFGSLLCLSLLSLAIASPI